MADVKKKAKEDKLRYKLVSGHLNPLADAILTIVLSCLGPVIWAFTLIHDKLMYKFLNKCYIYNVSWEDPRMDQRVFNLNDKDHVITIASAGCNVLDYIIEGAQVTAVDFNSCQIALTDLKKAAILNLEYEQFWEIFSLSNMKLLQEVYHTKLRASLRPDSAEFWDTGIYSIKSFMYSGSSGFLAWVIFRVFFPLFGLGFVRKCIEDKDAAKLRSRISEHAYGIRSLAWVADNIFLRLGCCLAGVPEKQMALGLHRPNNIALVLERIIFSTDLVNDNYFFAGYFLGYYQENNCPRYLERGNFDKMKKNLAKNKLILHHGTILEAIDKSKSLITVASLLDHMDWMSDRDIQQELTHLTKKMDPVRGKIFWRTYADDVHAAPLQWLNPVKVDDSDDRVGMYFTTWISELKNVDVVYEERRDTTQSKGAVANIATGVKMVTAPLWKHFVSTQRAGHAKDMEAFYKYQKDGYDSFREGLLHARPTLMEAFPLSKKGKMVWVDVGGGTARNLEFFTVETIRKYFKEIYIVDISKSLLEVARNRVELMKLTDIVHVVEHDFTAESVFKELPTEGQVDVVTMSYSFSMIPNQEAAVKNSTRLLKANGHLCIADFFLQGVHDKDLPPLNRRIRAIESVFHKIWFSLDAVYLLENKNLMHLDDLEMVCDYRFRGAVPFLPFLQPYHGICIAKKSK